jgi:hypothetical protein
LRPELDDHGRRQFDTVHADAALAEGDGDAAGADPELDGGARPGQVSRKTHGRFYDSRLEPLQPLLPVALAIPWLN